MRCPVGLVDRHDARRHTDHGGCSNGFIYTKAGLVISLFQGNSMHASIDDPGVLFGATVQCTFKRFYETCEGKPDQLVMLAPFDRLYLDEEAIAVVTWECFEHHASGIDKLRFPAVEVVDLIDADGHRFQQGDDFKILADGRLSWTGNRPSFNPDSEQGKVCSVRYHYRPYWYVKHMVHEVRVAQSEADFISGERGIVRMPQAAMLQREFVFEAEERDPEAPNPTSPRQQKAPRDLSFGPR